MHLLTLNKPTAHEIISAWCISSTPPTSPSVFSLSFYHICEPVALHLPTPALKHSAVSYNFETQELKGVIVLHPFGLQDEGGGGGGGDRRSGSPTLMLSLFPPFILSNAHSPSLSEPLCAGLDMSKEKASSGLEIEKNPKFKVPSKCFSIWSLAANQLSVFLTCVICCLMCVLSCYVAVALINNNLFNLAHTHSTDHM